MSEPEQSPDAQADAAAAPSSAPSPDAPSPNAPPSSAPLANAARAAWQEPSEAAGNDELSPEQLKKRARWGVVALVIRTVVMQLTIFGGNILLARILDPGEFGIFAVAQFVLAFFTFFGDAGLGAALVQKKSLPGQRELSSVFCLQLLLASVVLLVIGLGADGIYLLWDDLPEGSAWLLRALSISLVFTVGRVIPTILMERELLFGRLAVLDVLNTATFFGVATVTAYLGWGTWALVTGVLVQAVVVGVATFIMRPWRPQLVLDKKVLAPILRFSIPFQAKNLIGFANGAVAPLYAGAILGKRPLGFINWAQGTAYFPLKLVEIMTRVTFPLFSRLQHEKRMLAESLARSLQICALGTLAFVALIFSLGEPLVRIVYTAKWLPALPLLYIFTGAISLGFLAPLVASALDAQGKPGIFFRLSIGWTTLAWVVVVFTTPAWGMVGFVAGFCVHIIVGNIAVIFVIRWMIPGTALWPRVRAPIFVATATALLGRFVVAPHVSDWLSLGGGILVCAFVYAGLLRLLDWPMVRDGFAIVRDEKDPDKDDADRPKGDEDRGKEDEERAKEDEP